MKDDSVIFIGLDTSKLKISVAIADGVRNGEITFVAATRAWDGAFGTPEYRFGVAYSGLKGGGVQLVKNVASAYASAFYKCALPDYSAYPGTNLGN